MRIHLDAEPIPEPLFALTLQFRPIGKDSPARQSRTEKDVGGQGKVWTDGYLLVKDAHPSALRLGGTGGLKEATLQQEPAFICSMDSAQNLNQRGFARTVFPSRPVDTPLLKGQRNRTQRLNLAEPFAKLLNVQQRRGTDGLGRSHGSLGTP